MESISLPSSSSSFYIKTFLSASFIIGSLVYIYYNFINTKIKPKIINSYIDSYIRKIQEWIKGKPNWKSDLSLLAHINYILNELVNIKFKENNIEDYDLRIRNYDKKPIWEKLIEKDLPVYQKIKSEIIDEVFINYYEIDMTDIIPLLNCSLINLEENKGFKKLIYYPKKEVSKIMSSNIDFNDCFFFCTCKTIEYEKLVEKDMQNLNGLTKRVIKFKYLFQDEFFSRFKFDSVYLPDIMFYKGGEKEEKKNLLINKIIY